MFLFTMSHFDDYLPVDNGKSCFHIRFNNPPGLGQTISNVRASATFLGNIFALVLLGHFNWIER